MRTIEEIMSDLAVLAKAADTKYSEFVTACDKFAEALNYREDWVLGKALPKNSDQRRGATRLQDWLSLEKPSLAKSISEIQAKERRKALIEKLSLTKEDIETLGIDA